MFHFKLLNVVDDFPRSLLTINPNIIFIVNTDDSLRYRQIIVSLFFLLRRVLRMFIFTAIFSACIHNHNNCSGQYKSHGTTKDNTISEHILALNTFHYFKSFYKINSEIVGKKV